MKNNYLQLILALSFCIITVSRAQVVTQTLSYTGAVQIFTVPTCVNQISITCYGAQGSNGAASPTGGGGGIGGFGAMVTGLYATTPGAILNFYVGGTATGSLGGFNGGGNGAVGNSGGGGGASDVRAGSTAIANRVMVAGGGGGGGNGGCNTPTISGGGGGFGGGGNGSNGVTSTGGGPGFGAVGINGGAGGPGCAAFLGAAGTNGAQGLGGNGGVGPSVCTATVSGGGGGGGYDGGGGGGGGSAGTTSCTLNEQGAGGGGAGGTNYFSAAFTNTAVTNSVQLGNGKIIISFSPVVITRTIAATSASICTGGTSSLTVTGASNYTWNTGSNAATLAVSPTVTSNYTVTVLIPDPLVTCTGTGAITIPVAPLPTISVNSGSVCYGSAYTLTPSGASTYTFQGGNAVVTPTASRTYTVIGTSSVGCVSQSFATANVSVSPAPIITVNNGTVCENGSFTLTPSGASTYTFIGGGPVVTPTTNSSYSVSGTNSLGCVSQSFAIASISISPSPILSVAGGTVCQGVSFTLVPSGASTYTFINGGPVVSPSVTTTYSVLGTNSLGCVSALHGLAEVKVYQSPTITVNSGTICAGNSFTITPAGAATYTIEGGNTVVSPTTTTTYSVTGSNTLGCVALAAAISSVDVNPSPSVLITGPSTVCAGQTVTLTVAGADSYSWSTGNVGPIVIVSPTITTTYVSTGTASVKGCSAEADLTITVETCTGIKDNRISLQHLSLYPNPANGDVYIDLANGLEKTIVVSDINGKVIVQQSSDADKINVDLKQLQNGIYFVKVASGGAEQTLKVIKQ